MELTFIVLAFELDQAMKVMPFLYPKFQTKKKKKFPQEYSMHWSRKTENLGTEKTPIEDPFIEGASNYPWGMDI